MLARKMYRLVKELEKRERDNESLRRDSSDTWTLTEAHSAASALSKVMTRKKAGEALQLQVEIETDAQWKLLLRREGLVVVEVYAGWSGPCVSMTSLLKKAKVDTNDDRLTLALANSDNIGDLKVFKNQSEPAWVFFGGGKPVRLMRGANAAKLVEAIRNEFDYELLCMEGKAKRHLISLRDEADRRKRAESEAMRLALEDKIRNAVANTKEESDKESCEVESYKEKEIISEMKSLKVEEVGETGSTEERRDSNLTLMDNLEKYTVIALQNYLLETGAVTEIKDLLRNEFKIVQERYIVLEEDGVRKLFGIPYHLEIPVETPEEDEEVMPGDLEDGEGTAEEGDGEAVAVEGHIETSNVLHKPLNVEHQGDIPSRPGSRAAGVEGDEGGNEGGEDEGEEQAEVEVAKVPKVEIVPVPLPEELVGDTLLFLLESVELQKLLEEMSKDAEVPTADDFIRRRVGPEGFEEAKESAPESLHALYGREEYAVGVWCPRKYDEKRYVMLNFFPRFVTEMLMPPPKEIPKYIVAIFPALFANEIMENAELVSNAKDVVAQGKVNIPGNLLDRMLKSKGLEGEDLEMQKKALTGFDMFAVSVNEKNPLIVPTLASLEPLHLSVDNENGMYETAKLFPYLGVLIDEDFLEDEDELIYKELIVERLLGRSPKIKLAAILDDDWNLNEEDPLSSTGATEDNEVATGEVIVGNASQETINL